jgi:hypothetical protein
MHGGLVSPRAAGAATRGNPRSLSIRRRSFREGREVVEFEGGELLPSSPPARSRSRPARPIIAALSAQSRGGGKAIVRPSRRPRASVRSRREELHATPPLRSTRGAPVRRAAASIFATRTSTSAAWKLAQTSATKARSRPHARPVALYELRAVLRLLKETLRSPPPSRDRRGERDDRHARFWPGDPRPGCRGSRAEQLRDLVEGLPAASSRVARSR